MMKLFLIIMLSISLAACNSQTKSTTSATRGHDFDNTEKNVRDRDSATMTPFDQSESATDLKITQNIRKALVSDDSLSTNAKNVKIITVNGVVTLRGPVASLQEKEAIANKAKAVQGVERIDNQLDVTSK